MPSSVERVNKPIFYRKLRPIGINYPHLVSGSTRTSSRRKNQIGWGPLRSTQLPTINLGLDDRGIQAKSQEEIYKALVDYRMGDVSSPKLDMREALSFECEHFVDCVRNKKVPRSDGMAGLAVLRILEAASISLAK
jgi:predicted dehydrogenase